MSIVTKNITIDGADTIALSVSGGMGVSGNINSGNINGQTITSSSTITATNVLTPKDGANEGTIDQVSTELTLSGNGNKVAISSGNSLVFKNDSTVQLSAFSGLHKTDPVDIHGFLQGRTIIKQTFSLQNPNLSLIGVGGGNILCYNLGILRKGTVVQGVFFWADVAKTSGNHIGLYRQSDVTLVASTQSNIAISAGMNYIPLSTSYTIPTTEVYYWCAVIASGVNGLTMNNSAYFNYGLTATTGKFTVATQYTNTIYSTLPSSFSGVGMTASTYNVFVGIYG